MEEMYWLKKNLGCTDDDIMGAPVRLTLREWDILEMLSAEIEDWKDYWLKQDGFSEYRFLSDWYFGYVKNSGYDGGDSANTPFQYSLWHNAIHYMMHIGILIGDVDSIGRYKFTINLPKPNYDIPLMTEEDYEEEDRIEMEMR